MERNGAKRSHSDGLSPDSLPPSKLNRQDEVADTAEAKAVGAETASAVDFQTNEHDTAADLATQRPQTENDSSTKGPIESSENSTPSAVKNATETPTNVNDSGANIPTESPTIVNHSDAKNPTESPKNIDHGASANSQPHVGSLLPWTVIEPNKVFQLGICKITVKPDDRKAATKASQDEVERQRCSGNKGSLSYWVDASSGGGERPGAGGFGVVHPVPDTEQWDISGWTHLGLHDINPLEMLGVVQAMKNAVDSARTLRETNPEALENLRVSIFGDSADTTRYIGKNGRCDDPDTPKGKLAKRLEDEIQALAEIAPKALVDIQWAPRKKTDPEHLADRIAYKSMTQRLSYHIRQPLHTRALHMECLVGDPPPSIVESTFKGKWTVPVAPGAAPNSTTAGTQSGQQAVPRKENRRSWKKAVKNTAQAVSNAVNKVFQHAIAGAPISSRTRARVPSTHVHIELPPLNTPHIELPPPNTPHIELPPLNTPHTELPPPDTPRVELPPPNTPHIELPPLNTTQSVSKKASKRASKKTSKMASKLARDSRWLEQFDY